MTWRRPIAAGHDRHLAEDAVMYKLAYRLYILPLRQLRMHCQPLQSLRNRSNARDEPNWIPQVQIVACSSYEGAFLSWSHLGARYFVALLWHLGEPSWRLDLWGLLWYWLSVPAQEPWMGLTKWMSLCWGHEEMTMPLGKEKQKLNILTKAVQKKQAASWVKN